MRRALLFLLLLTLTLGPVEARRGHPHGGLWGFLSMPQVGRAAEQPRSAPETSQPSESPLRSNRMAPFHHRRARSRSSSRVARPKPPNHRRARSRSSSRVARPKPPNHRRARSRRRHDPVRRPRTYQQQPVLCGGAAEWCARNLPTTEPEVGRAAEWCARNLPTTEPEVGRAQSAESNTTGKATLSNSSCSASPSDSSAKEGSQGPC